MTKIESADAKSTITERTTLAANGLGCRYHLDTNLHICAGHTGGYATTGSSGLMPGTWSFFVGGLVLALILVGVLVSPALQPQATAVSSEVTAGYVAWQEYGCEGCHTLYGHGGAYAPDLTHIHATRGETYLSEFMVNPNAFHPQARLMPRFNISIAETANLFAFLEWVGSTQVAENFPPRPINVSGGGSLTTNLSVNTSDDSSVTDPQLEHGRSIYSQRCASCHSLDAKVVLTGPPLAGIADTAWYRIPGTAPEEYIRNSILKPDDYLVEGFADVMQKNFGELLTSEELDSLIAFLMTLEAEE